MEADQDRRELMMGAMVGVAVATLPETPPAQTSSDTSNLPGSVPDELTAALGGLETAERLNDEQIDGIARDLLAELSLEEKIGMMSGGEGNSWDVTLTMEETMPGYSAEHAIRMRIGRLNHYVVVAAYNVFGIVANLFIVLSFARTANFPSKLAIALAIVAVAVIAILPARSVLQELDAIRRDKVDEWKGSHAEAFLEQVPISTFVSLTIAFNTLIAVVQLWALFSV